MYMTHTFKMGEKKTSINKVLKLHKLVSCIPLEFTFKQTYLITSNKAGVDSGTKNGIPFENLVRSICCF